MLKKLLLNIVFFSFCLSCKQEKPLVGHWHEYQNLNQDFENCYIITDSTISINKSTYGGTFSLESLDLAEVQKYSPLLDKTIPNYKIQGNSIKFDNGIEWIKQSDSPETYLKDFSAGYKIKIHPFELESETWQPIKFTNGRQSIILALGQLKTQHENQDKGLFPGKYYFQMNDKLTSDFNDLVEYINCIHCQSDKMDLYVNMDKSSPLDQKKILDSAVTFSNIKSEQVYYLYANFKKMKSGYKNTTANNTYSK